MTQVIVGFLGAKGAGKDTAALTLINDFDYTRISFATGIYAQASNAFNVTVEDLENRELKETEQRRFSLELCSEMDFVRIVLEYLGYEANSIEIAVNALQVGTESSLEQLQSESETCRIWHALKAPRSPRWILQLWGSEYKRLSRFGYDSYWRDQVATTIKENPSKNFVITDVRFLNEVELLKSIGGTLIRVRHPELELAEEYNRKANGTAAHASETELLGFKVDFEVVNKAGDFEHLSGQITRLEASNFKHLD